MSAEMERLCSWVAGWRERELDADAAAIARVRLLDYVANVAGGSDREPVRVLAGYAARFAGAFPLPGGASAATEWAACVYGAAAHVLECDDTHQPSSTHPGAPVLSAAVALAAETGASMETVVRAAIAGYEVMCRLAATVGPRQEYARGFHPTGTAGVFGAAAAAAVVLGLDERGIQGALGIGSSMSSGSMTFLVDGAWNKILNPGHAAASGITAAQLAQRGFKGPADPFSPPHGYFAGHADEDGLAAMLAGLDQDELAIHRTSIKAHGCCRYEQAPIDAILALRAAHGIAPDDVAAVHVGVLSAGWQIVAEPMDAKRRPASTVDAQFSMPFGAAVALVRGSASPADHARDALADPEIRRLMQRVHCHRDEQLDREYPAKWPATVDIELTDGRRVTEHVDFPKGDPENALSREELVTKLATLAPAVAQDTRDALARFLLDESLDAPASGLIELLGRALGAEVAR
jgi:2-methylcitrate dehydratase PrpD